MDTEIQEIGFIKTRVPVAYTRRKKFEVEVYVPDSKEVAINIIKDALIAATAVAAVASFAATPGSAWPAFKAAFMASLLSNVPEHVAGEILRKMDFRTKTSALGDWKRKT